jgi:hypothetical protein
MMTSAAETPSSGVQIDRDAAPVIAHRYRAVGIQHDIDAVAVAGQAFVDRVVDNFVHHVVQARTVIGVADIHPRALAHRVETFQTLMESAPYGSFHACLLPAGTLFTARLVIIADTASACG